VNHLLFGFALCAAFVVYPGGLAALVAALAGGGAALLRRGGGRWRAVLGAAPSPSRTILGLALVGLVLAPMPWPDNPVAPVAVSWASGRDFGGIGLSLAGLCGLQLLGAERPRDGSSLAVAGAWSLGLVVLALAVHAITWSSLLSAGGLGAELGRVLLAVLGLVIIPLALGGPPGGVSLRSCSWAAGAGMVLLLALPQLQTAPFPLALAAWWVLLVVLGLAWSAGSAWGPGGLRRLGLIAPAATLDIP
jgi:hypothetical protein